MNALLAIVVLPLVIAAVLLAAYWAIYGVIVAVRFARYLPIRNIGPVLLLACGAGEALGQQPAELATGPLIERLVERVATGIDGVQERVSELKDKASELRQDIKDFREDVREHTRVVDKFRRVFWIAVVLAGLYLATPLVRALVALVLAWRGKS